MRSASIPWHLDSMIWIFQANWGLSQSGPLFAISCHIQVFSDCGCPVALRSPSQRIHFQTPQLLGIVSRLSTCNCHGESMRHIKTATWLSFCCRFGVHDLYSIAIAQRQSVVPKSHGRRPSQGHNLKQVQDLKHDLHWFLVWNHMISKQLCHGQQEKTFFGRLFEWLSCMAEQDDNC